MPAAGFHVVANVSGRFVANFRRLCHVEGVELHSCYDKLSTVLFDAPSFASIPLLFLFLIGSRWYNESRVIYNCFCNLANGLRLPHYRLHNAFDQRLQTGREMVIDSFMLRVIISSTRLVICSSMWSRRPAIASRKRILSFIRRAAGRCSVFAGRCSEKTPSGRALNLSSHSRFIFIDYVCMMWSTVFIVSVLSVIPTFYLLRRRRRLGSLTPEMAPAKVKR